MGARMHSYTLLGLYHEWRRSSTLWTGPFCQKCLFYKCDPSTTQCNETITDALPDHPHHP
eukprot:1159656-Pelagomonas_calceolata.AAC.9